MSLVAYWFQNLSLMFWLRGRGAAAKEARSSSVAAPTAMGAYGSCGPMAAHTMPLWPMGEGGALNTVTTQV